MQKTKIAESPMAVTHIDNLINNIKNKKTRLNL